VTRKLVDLVTEDWAFWRHRFPMAHAAKADGFDMKLHRRAARALAELRFSSADIGRQTVAVDRRVLAGS
jgi:hypothetical protein